MERPDLLDDSRFDGQVSRARNREAIDAVVSDWTASFEIDDLNEKLERASIPAGPVNTIEDIVKDPHFEAREMLLSLHDRVLGELSVPGIVPKLSETPGKVNWLGGTIGEHNQEIYGGLLNMGTDEIEGLRRRGIV